MESAEQGMGSDCKWIIGILGGVVVTLSGALVKLAKVAWDERMTRVNDLQKQKGVVKED